MTPPPVAVGLFLCEQVIVDQHSGNPSLINMFTGLPVDDFPSEEQRFSVFASLTNGRGQATIRLLVNRLDTGDCIYQQQYPLHFPDPLLLVNVHIRVRRIRFEASGEYEFVLYVDSDPVAQKILRGRQR